MTAVVPGTVTYTISFDPGEGSGTMENVVVNAGTEYTLPVNGFTAPGGKEFDRWDQGAVGTKITVNSDITVTAQWKDKETPPSPPGYDFKFTFVKAWQGDHEDSIDWVFYNPDGTVAHKKFNKKIISDTEWRYEAWFPTGAEYFLIETVPEGYQARYENVGAHAEETDRCYNGGTIINYKIPKTGDDSHPALWIALAALGAVGLGALAICVARDRKRRK